MLELDVTKMLTSYLLEATKLRDSMQEEVKKHLVSNREGNLHAGYFQW